MQPQKEYTILVIDDDPSILDLVGRTLRREGYIVYTCEQWAKVASLLRRTKPDLILLDYNMPSLRGDEICRILKSDSIYRGLKVVLFSIEDPVHMRKVAQSCGADGFIPKAAGVSLPDRLREFFPAASAPPPTSSPTLSRVLVVDDSRLVRKLARQALTSQFSCQVLEAGNGGEALDLLASDCRFDLIILDLNMARMNGLQFLERYREQPDLRSIPVIICSTEGKEDDVLRGLSVGARGYLIKPFTPESMCLLVAQVLSRNLKKSTGGGME